MFTFFFIYNLNKGDENIMGRIRREKNRTWLADDKLKIINENLINFKSTPQISKEYDISQGMIINWIKKYKQFGYEGLVNKKKPGNPLSKYNNKKDLTKEEQLEYENMKLRIENEMLKKGFLMKEDGTYVKFMK